MSLPHLWIPFLNAKRLLPRFLLSDLFFSVGFRSCHFLGNDGGVPHSFISTVLLQVKSYPHCHTCLIFLARFRSTHLMFLERPPSSLKNLQCLTTIYLLKETLISSGNFENSLKISLDRLTSMRSLRQLLLFRYHWTFRAIIVTHRLESDLSVFE